MEPSNPYWKEDGSVNTDDGIQGEIASPKFRIDRMKQFRDFTKNNMPFEVNQTCGIHVHVSFNDDLAYAKCMDAEFFEAFRKEVKEFMMDGSFNPDVSDRFYNRYHEVTDGRTNFCANEFVPESQVNETNGIDFPCENGRYTQLNYAYKKFRTIECRIFPSTTNHEELIRMVEWFIKFTNSYLKKQTSERANYQKIVLKKQTEKSNKEILILCV